ncbi:DUF4157 domain-containing protein [Sphingomonas sp. 28-63-12]|uniref:eCIS core domain-containing protein n=1 Tax=Sphingomonas sp. 28-63-12 TaxID=1970434 RepID=UPI0035A89190
MSGDVAQARAADRATTPTGAAAMAGPRQQSLTAMAESLNQAPPVQRLRDMAPPSDPGGLPSGLRAGIESLSGVSMAGVQVHRNSAMPAQLNALAYAKGRDIHLGPGQEQHLPHEAWHVVQQAQGRVQPTTQLKQGVPVNDDAGLEHEADIMGARAATVGAADLSPAGGAAPGVQRRSAESGDATAAHQLKVDPVLAPVVLLPRAPTFAQAISSRASYDQSGVTVDIAWPKKANDIYKIIEVARPNLDDDDEIAELDAFEVRTDALVNRGNAHIVTFDTTANHQRVAIGDLLHTDLVDLHAVYLQIRRLFVVNEGGFSAKGRATDIPDAEVSTDHQGEIGRDDSFISDIDIGGETLTDTYGVSKPATAPVAGAQRLFVMGQNRLPAANKNFYVDNLADLDVPQEVEDLTGFAGVPRGQGQEVAMDRTNARGYAWVTDTPGWNTTQWEWLHIRGASLGGQTDATNLVLGTRDANTHMIPFESNLKALAVHARDNDYFYGLDATWDVADMVHSHAYREISISWTLTTSDLAPIDLENVTGSAEFKPLATGSVLSKNEIGFLEDALRDARPDYPPESDEESEDDSEDVDMKIDK